MSMAQNSITQYTPLLFSFDSAKSALFYYVLLTQGVKLQRHIRARGIVTSAKELYTWIAQVLQFSS
jgi:sphinganine-1-phosphate aldolase